VIEKHQCEDCKLSFPLKHFAMYRGKRHPLCRTCLAIDVAEFKEWVLPYVEARKAELDAPYHIEDWEIAVAHRLELSSDKRAVMLRRKTHSIQRMRTDKSNQRNPRFTDPVVIRPWKYEREAA
jgi:hypothetical protein